MNLLEKENKITGEIDSLIKEMGEGGKLSELGARLKASLIWDVAFDAREVTRKVPYISFPSEWEIAFIPPITMATSRFWIEDKETRAHCSVYLDFYDMLGYMSEPYWELYPAEDGDPERFLLNETTQLVDGIKRSFEAQNKLKKEKSE